MKHHTFVLRLTRIRVCKHRLASVPQLLTVLAGVISSLSIEVVGDCLTGLPIGFPLQPARVVSYPMVVPDMRKHCTT